MHYTIKICILLDNKKTRKVLFYKFFEIYKNGVSHKAITISIIVVVVAIDTITGNENIPINASVLKK